MNPMTASVLRVAAIVSAAAAAALHSVLLALPPLAAIVLYGRMLFRALRSNPARLAEQADQPYVMGYSATLSAFVGLLLPIIWTNQLPKSLSGVVLTIALALASTVVGVVTMVALKDAADALLASSGSDRPASTAAPGSPSEPFGTDPAIEEARRAAFEAQEKRLAETETRIVGFIDDLSVQVQRLTEAVTQLTTLAASGASGAEAFATGVTQMQQVMRDYVDLVRTVVPTVEHPAYEERIQ
jgi:hypothetical protein